MIGQARTYRTVQAQTLHYLARPHAGVPSGPVGGPAAWRRDHVAEAARWTVDLRDDDVDEIERALEASASIPLPKLRAQDFALPSLRSRIQGWARRVHLGLGFIRIRGVPLTRWSPADTERFYWGLGQHLGRPGAQNGRGELLGHVRDLRLGRDGQVRQYQTSEEIRYHCDAADAVALLCVKTAKRGGLSRIASSVAIFDALQQRRPDLVPHLFEPMWFDTRGDGGVDAFRARPATFYDGRLRTFYHSEYMRTVTRHPGIPPLTEAQRELLAEYDALADDPTFHLQMELRPGDIQLISNHTVVHARTGYDDHERLEDRRHLLRLWLSLPERMSARARLSRARAVVGIVASLAARRRVRARTSS